MKSCEYRLSWLLLCALFVFPIQALAQDLSPLDPLAQELLDNQSQTSLMDVDFSLTLSPQIVEVGDLVTYTFSILNTGNQAIENARISHMLPLGLTFITPEDFAGNLTIESTNSANDTLILRDLYLAADMNQPFVFTIQALINDWSNLGRSYNQAILDVFTASTHDQIVSDSNLNSAIEEQTMLNIVASGTNLTPRVISGGISNSSSGKAGNRWAGMRREDLLKGAIGATQAESKAFVTKLNQSKPYQVKTYVDRNGKTKFYGIEKGKTVAADIKVTPKKPPLARSSRTGVISVRPKATLRNTTISQQNQNAINKNLKLRQALRRR